MTPTNDKVDQSGADERLLKIADWLGSQVSMGQNSPDEPPDYCSQFDYEAAQCSAEIRSIAGEIASASPALQAQIAQAVDNDALRKIVESPQTLPTSEAIALGGLVHSEGVQAKALTDSIKDRE